MGADWLTEIKKDSLTDPFLASLLRIGRNPTTATVTQLLQSMTTPKGVLVVGPTPFRVPTNYHNVQLIVRSIVLQLPSYLLVLTLVWIDQNPSAPDRWNEPVLHDMAAQVEAATSNVAVSHPHSGSSPQPSHTSIVLPPCPE